MTTTSLPESQLGPAERLLDLVLTSSAHLWHNRPGVEVNGVWQPAPRKRNSRKARARGPGRVAPGLHAPAAEALYGRLLDIYQLNTELMAHFASYVLKETEWRDLKVACAALMLVQPHAGQPIRDDKGEVAFYDDDFRQVGEAMMLFYESKSTKMMTPKAVLRIAELLENPGIATLNRTAGFGDPGSKHPPLGRWPKAAQHWLAIREQNFKLLQGLVKAGYKETIKAIARKCGYKPQSQAFFEVLGWKQSQAKGGHRTVGLQGLNVIKHGPFTGMTEAEICEHIVAKKLSYKEAIGRLPPEVGLTPAIMVTLLPSLSDRDLRILTPTLEQLELLKEPEIKARWDRAIASATDQRSLNIVKNVQNKELREKLEEAADNAARKAVTDAVTEAEVHVMFLIDKSGSMQGAIEASKEALARILAGFPPERVHIACFDTMGIVLRPKAPTHAAVQHMLSGIHAAGGTVHGTAVRALYKAGVRIPADAKLLVVVAGDEAGEYGPELAKVFDDHGYKPAALALLLNVAPGGARGHSIRQCAQHLRVPFHEITIDHFADPYQVPRVLRTLIESAGSAGSTAGASHWVEKVMATPILQIRIALPRPGGDLPMDYRKFLGKEERLVFPYLGGSTVEGHGRVLRLKERPARGWHLFRVVGRNAWPVEPASLPDDVQARVVRGHHYGGYLFREGAPPAELELCDGEQEMFAPCKAYLWSNNDLIFGGVDFEGEAEGQVREALEELRPLTTVRGVPATLRLAYGFAVLQRRARQLGAQVAPAEVLRDLVPVAEMGVPQANVVLQRLMQERVLAAARVAPALTERSGALSEEEWDVAPTPALTEMQRARLMRREQASGQRARQQRIQELARSGRPGQMVATLDNASERAEAALEAAGARPTATRLLDPERLEVRYRFLNYRFLTVVHPLTLQVLDAGICLAGADRMVTLDSLPSVIREGIETHRLVITRHG